MQLMQTQQRFGSSPLFRFIKMYFIFNFSLFDWKKAITVLQHILCAASAVFESDVNTNCTIYVMYIDMNAAVVFDGGFGSCGDGDDGALLHCLYFSCRLSHLKTKNKRRNNEGNFLFVRHFSSIRICLYIQPMLLLLLLCLQSFQLLVFGAVEQTALMLQIVLHFNVCISTSSSLQPSSLLFASFTAIRCVPRSKSVWSLIHVHSVLYRTIAYSISICVPLLVCVAHRYT